MTITGAPNLRDAARGALQRGVLYRAASPHLASPDEIAALGALGIDTYLDLRSDAERRTFGDGGLAAQGIRTVHVPLIRDLDRQLRDLPTEDWDHLDHRVLYLTMLQRSASKIAEAVGVIADADAACLVTCAGGRDRTGIVVALALAAADAHPDDIVDDYTATDTDIARIVERLNTRPLPDGFPRNLAPRDHIACDGDAMRAVLDHLDDRGGPGPFLLDNGLAPSSLQRLRRRLGPTT